MLDPQPGERVCDPAAGTCGFLVNAWQHLLETHTDPRDITYDEEGYPHGLTGSKLYQGEYEFSQREALTGYDSDSGMTMLRIGSMNLMLHGIPRPDSITPTRSPRHSRKSGPTTWSSPIRPSRAPSTRRT